MANARTTPRAKAWKWSIAGSGVAAFLVMAQAFHVGDASRPSTPAAAGTSTTAAQLAQTYGGATMVCVAGPYGYSCSPLRGYASGGGGTSAYGGTFSGGYAGAFANTRSSGS